MKSILLLTIVCLLAKTANAAPANDNFENAQVITGSFTTVSGNATGATRELGEPISAVNIGNSIWYKWTAPEFGRVEFGAIVDGATYSYQNSTEVFVGSDLLHLTEVTQFSGSMESRGSAIVGKNVTYYLRLSGIERSSPATFRFFLNFDTTGFLQTDFQSTSWTNDLFSQAQLLTGTNAKAIGYPGSATREVGEPTSGAFNTLWWKWTAPSSGITIFSTVGGDYANSLTVGEGTQVYDLDVTSKSTYSNYAEMAVKTTIGHTYYISIGHQSPTQMGQDLLSVIHTATSSVSSGSGLGGKLTTLSRDIVNHSTITGSFTALGITGLNIKVPPGFTIGRNSFVSPTTKWSFTINKIDDTITAKSAIIVVEGTKNGKIVAKITKTFRVW